MRRFTLFRAALLLTLIIVALVTSWFTLPFPQLPDELSKTKHINDVLHSGEILTTVHRDGYTFWPQISLNPEDFQPENNGRWSAVILQWQLCQASPNDNIILRIGSETNRTYPDTGASIDLTLLAQKEPQFIYEGLILWTGAGDQDGYSLPYFDYSDATLFYHQVSHSWQLVKLRLLVADTGVVQVWKDMDDWDSFNASSIALIDDDDRSNGLVATFTFPTSPDPHQHLSLHDIRVAFQDISLPSRTYQIRKFILNTMVPMYFGAVAICEASAKALAITFKAILLTAVAYALLVSICWIVLRPQKPFRRWSRNFWLTKHVSRRLLSAPKPQVWGLVGPLETYESDQSRSTPSPRPLNNPFDFFRSSSPLDDLLVTFAATRWMVKPMWPKAKQETLHHTDYGKSYEKGYHNLDQHKTFSSWYR